MKKETDKRVEANKLVKIKIGRALVKLMETQKFSDITITQIVQQAGVARASYYRNFSSKEEVLSIITEDIWVDYQQKTSMLKQSFFSYDSVLLAFRYFRTYKRFMLSVYNAGLSSIYLEMLDQLTEQMAGDMAINDIKRYSIYYYSGALFNVFLKWLENGMRERPEEMADMFYNLIPDDFPLKNNTADYD